MNAVVMLREAASQTMNFDMNRLPLVQSALVNLFTRCADGLTVEQCLDGMSRVGPDAVMDAVMCRIALRFLARMPHDRLVREVYDELAQDLDGAAVTEAARIYDPLSTKLRREAEAMRGLGFVAITRTQGEEFARDLEESALQALRLEQRCAALEAQIRMMVGAQYSPSIIGIDFAQGADFTVDTVRSMRGARA
ncbi:hypothetical protein [Gluconobacter frateurii]|uniref:Uncharacterized protein n=1 Tax=Gluconobacter frateurii NRIC 0228 TaxID=1307946 RepID=A0ABQ0Q8X1_9PROT|nr:hypothetical protein [Gluconobacter frateurii]GBR09426.1 hypothetical protein AA0228_0671 [Gluconobacter frateurii NRIC 0228]GLP91966.1 hypothetical protein GCM10007868_30410 [Gluconobacter frateurii]